MTLTEFLLERIAEDEAAARDIPEGSWEDACSTTRRYDHVFRWSPARVLAECEAKRRIVGLHDVVDVEGNCAFCIELAPCQHLRLLALPYADHDDYREEWKP